jgi:dCMP deaminase
MSRIKKDDYYLGLAKVVGQRSTCFRNRLGAVIVRDDQIVATGYIGAPRKTKDCSERKNCLRDKLQILHGQRYEICRSVHAEQNAIINAARAGVSILGGTMYLSGTASNGLIIDTFPCFICKKMIINSGLENVVCSTKTGKIKVFSVKKWKNDWQTKDILDDKYQYGKDQNKEIN